PLLIRNSPDFTYALGAEMRWNRKLIGCHDESSQLKNNKKEHLSQHGLLCMEICQSFIGVSMWVHVFKGQKSADRKQMTKAEGEASYLTPTRRRS
ncbi:MAG: hypothetical protein PVI82_04490, partial [Desulfobacterales bacterium]